LLCGGGAKLENWKIVNNNKCKIMRAPHAISSMFAFISKLGGGEEQERSLVELCSTKIIGKRFFKLISFSAH
jgi:hypothetical protein